MNNFDRFLIESNFVLQFLHGSFFDSKRLKYFIVYGSNILSNIIKYF